MTRHVVITLTKKEAIELQLVAENGYGDGDYYQQVGNDSQDHKAFQRAIYKLRAARHKEKK